MKTILAVDDNVLILKSLRRLFARTDYEIVIFENPLSALEHMDNHEVNVVISDMRMPIMDGYEFLTEVKRRHPGIFRIVLSGYTDEKVVMEALKHNIAKLYISKPWNDVELINRIDQIFETENQLNLESVRLVIQNLDELPSLKSSYMRILSLIDGDKEMQEIAEAIEADPPLTMKLLHVANSAFFGLKTGSVKHAAAFFGLKHIRNLVLSTAIIDQTGAFNTSNMYVKAMWNHALVTNQILQMIYERFLNKKISNESYSAGLLHNIGVATMFQVFGTAYSELLQRMNQGGRYIIKEEQESFHVTHQEVGAYLIRWWDLPFPLVEAALYHHQPLDKNVVHTELVYAVHIAQHYAWRIVNPSIVNLFQIECFDRLNIEMTVFENTFMTLEWKQGGF